MKGWIAKGRRGPPQPGAHCGAGCGADVNKLTALGIKNAPDGKLYDGGGLMLAKAGTKGKWLFRYTFPGGPRREMGLGPWPEVSLSDARAARDKWKAALRDGLDPITERARLAAETAAEIARQDPSFWDMVEEAFEAKKDGLRGGGYRGRWLSPLETHVRPKIGARRISTLTSQDFVTLLRPIWRKKHPTAVKAAQRAKAVLRHAKILGHDTDPDMIDRATHILGEVRHKVTHLDALPWQDIPALYASLDKLSPAHHILRWLILSGVRWDAAGGAQWDEIEESVWTVPAARVKGAEGKVSDFRVPVTPAMQDVLSEAAKFESPWLFPGRRGAITEAACRKVLAGRGTIHGLRTSFRTWAQDAGEPWDVAETILGHSIGGTVERSYARSDLLDRRRATMLHWGDFVTGTSSRVVRIR